MMLIDHNFLWNAIPNIALVFLLFYYLSIRKGTGAVLMALFIYLSLHGGYAIFAAATGDGINTMNELHYIASDWGAKLVGAFFLICCGVLLGVRLQHPAHAFQGNPYLVPGIIFALVLFLMLMAYGVTQLSVTDSLVYGVAHLSVTRTSKLVTIYKEILFATCMWGGALVFAVAIKQGGDYWTVFRKEAIVFLGALSAVMIVGGFYEIVSGMVWAGTYYPFGFSYRASGTLFNPNVLGFWCALLVLVVAFMFHRGWIAKLTVLGFMLLLVAALILASSRSGFVLSIINLLAISFFMMRDRKSIRLSAIISLWPLLSFLFAFGFYTAVIEGVSPSRHALVNTLFANLQRFLQLPADVFWIFVMKIYLPLVKIYLPLVKNPALMDFFSFLPTPESVQLAAETHEAGRQLVDAGHFTESITGRTLLDYTSDNSLMSIYAVGGKLALGIWLGLWSVFAWLGAVKRRKAPGIRSAYALAGLVFCFASGFFLRTPQLFPVWIFLSLVLGACLCWWLPVGNDNRNNGQELGEAKLLSREPTPAPQEDGSPCAS